MIASVTILVHMASSYHIYLLLCISFNTGPVWCDFICWLLCNSLLHFNNRSKYSSISSPEFIIWFERCYGFWHPHRQCKVLRQTTMSTTTPFNIVPKLGVAITWYNIQSLEGITYITGFYNHAFLLANLACNHWRLLCCRLL